MQNVCSYIYKHLLTLFLMTKKCKYFKPNLHHKFAIAIVSTYQEACFVFRPALTNNSYVEPNFNKTNNMLGFNI